MLFHWHGLNISPFEVRSQTIKYCKHQENYGKQGFLKLIDAFCCPSIHHTIYFLHHSFLWFNLKKLKIRKITPIRYINYMVAVMKFENRIFTIATPCKFCYLLLELQPKQHLQVWCLFFFLELHNLLQLVFQY